MWYIKVKALIIAWLMLVLSGCSTTPKVMQSRDLFHDTLFYHSEPIETESEIFALSDEARAFVQQHILIYRDPQKRAQKLADAMFSKAQLGLSYSSVANTNATNTFSSLRANCLSMTILTYALAQYAELDADFQEVFIPEYWIRREGQSFLNGHVNLVLKAKSDKSENNAVTYRSNGILVDFGNDGMRKHFAKRKVSKSRIIAMYYNNKGADAIVSKEYALAYQYFRRALDNDIAFIPAWSNLGVTYRLAGYRQYVEPVYHFILQRDPDNLNTLENLAVLKKLENKTSEARKIYQTLASKRQENPYYHFIQGEEEYEKGHWLAAAKHYQKAMRMDRTVHEFYFGLAKAWYQLGDLNKSRHYLTKAKMKAFTPDLEQKYQHKMDLLGRL